MGCICFLNCASSLDGKRLGEGRNHSRQANKVLGAMRLMMGLVWECSIPVDRISEQKDLVNAGWLCFFFHLKKGGW